MAGQTAHQDIARRYALAFFELAKEQSQIDRIAADLQGLKAMLAESVEFVRFIGSPTLRRTQEVQIITALCDKARFGDLTKKFLCTLAMKRRLAVLPTIITLTVEAIAKHKGEVTATVTSATPLDQTQTANIAATLKKALGLTVKVELQQDASILGGLLIQVGSMRIDNTVRSKLERMQRTLKNADTSTTNTKIKEVA